MRNITHSLLFYISILILITCFSCLVMSTKVHRLIPEEYPLRVSSPTKAHLKDGSLVVFDKGFKINADKLEGKGLLYNQNREYVNTISFLELDNVAFLEYFTTEVEGPSVLGSLLGPGIFVSSLSNEKIYKAFFGSCPTIYSFDGKNYSLQAECFSYSVCPLLEKSDTDRLDEGIPIENSYILKITNEALETHYINLLQLNYVEHLAKFEAFPNNTDDIIFFEHNNLEYKIFDKGNNEISNLLKKRDTNWFKTDTSVLETLTTQYVDDWIQINFDKPINKKNIVLALRIRNTLLNTILFYDIMLRSAGINAIDWMAGRNLGALYAGHFKKWYMDYFGIRVQVWDGNSFTTVCRIGDTGPIAWRQVALDLEIPSNTTPKIRLAFLPDNWIIDWVGVSKPVNESPTVHRVHCSSLEKIGPEKIDIDPSLILKADNNYLITYPAEAYLATFEVPHKKPEQERTYFLKSQGYYIEWLRPEWFKPKNVEFQEEELKMDDKTIQRVAKLWQLKKKSFEKDFFSSKISR